MVFGDCCRLSLDVVGQTLSVVGGCCWLPTIHVDSRPKAMNKRWARRKLKEGAAWQPVRCRPARSLSAGRRRPYRADSRPSSPVSSGLKVMPKPSCSPSAPPTSSAAITRWPPQGCWRTLARLSRLRHHHHRRRGRHNPTSRTPAAWGPVVAAAVPVPLLRCAGGRKCSPRSGRTWWRHRW
jgi:hypothetical protein